MKVISLFDGISCGRVALERAEVSIEEYHAWEIEPNAISIGKKNYSDNVYHGDVTEANFGVFKEYDLLIGGSPCTDLSNYKYFKDDVKGLEGAKSNLFWHYVRAFNTIKPRYFLLENVASMQSKWCDIISDELGVQPIMINSADFSAQERPRYYWTNIPVGNYEVKNIVLADIVLPAEEVPDKYWYNRDFTYNGADKKVEATLLGTGLMRNMREVYNLKSTCNTLLCDGDGGNRQKKIFQNGRCRKLTPIEYERLQTLPDNYTAGVSDNHRYTACGNAWTVDVIAHIFKGLVIPIDNPINPKKPKRLF